MTHLMSTDEMDFQPEAPASPAANADPIALRTDNRIPWMRDDIELYVEHPGGSRVQLPAATVDIGRQGLGITTHTFLHEGTRTMIRLPAIDGSPIDTHGEVRWCRYDDGLHQCGIQFTSAVQLERIVPRDQWTETMLRDDDYQIKGKVVHMFSSALDQHMLTLALRDTAISVEAVDTTGAVLDLIRNGDVDVLAIDLRTESADLAQFHVQIGQLGYGGPIIFIADTDDEVIAAQCIFEEPSAVLKSPIEGPAIANRVTEVLEKWQRLTGGDEALFTKLRRDDAVAGMLDGYHDACKTTADALRAKMVREDREGIVSLLRRIAGTAGTFGYPVLAKQAEAALSKLDKTGTIRNANAEIAQVRSVLRNLKGFANEAA